MTITASRPETQTTPNGWRVAVQLAKVEARQLLLHPASLFTLALAIGVMWVMHSGEAPVLNRAGATTVVPLILIAAGASIAAADASVRQWKTEQSEALDIAPVRPRIRTAGLLLAGTAPVVVGLLVQVVTLGVLMFDRPVTPLDVWDALAGAAVIALTVSIGVSLGRWMPSRFTGPLALVALIAAASFLGSYGMRQRFGEVVKWFAPFVALDWEPVEIVFRPTLPHVIYLAGLIGAFVCLALLRGTGPRALVLGCLVASGALVAVGVVGQQDAYAAFDADAALAQYMPPLANYACETKGNVEYCALAEYAAWIPEWTEMVDGVLAAVPGQVASQALLLRQYPTRLMDQGQSFTLDYEPGLATGVWWNRGSGGKTQADAYPFGMALGAASWAVGLPFERVAGHWVQEFDENGDMVTSEFVPGTEDVPEEDVEYAPYCSTLNQGRAVVALWLAAQVDDRTLLYLDERLERTQYPPVEEFVLDDGTLFLSIQGMIEQLDNGQYYPWYPYLYWIHEAYFANQLLDHPRNEVAGLIADNWDALTDPTTTTAEAVELLGIEPIPGLEEQMASHIAGDTFYMPCR